MMNHKMIINNYLLGIIIDLNLINIYKKNPKILKNKNN